MFFLQSASIDQKFQIAIATDHVHRLCFAGLGSFLVPGRYLSFKASFTMPPLSAIADELLRVLLGQEDGMSDEQLRTVFGQRYELLAPAINELLTMNRVQLFTQGSSLVYKAIKEEIAQKFDGLG
jgi:hypothetical protein